MKLSFVVGISTDVANFKPRYMIHLEELVAQGEVLIVNEDSNLIVAKGTLGKKENYLSVNIHEVLVQPIERQGKFIVQVGESIHVEKIVHNGIYRTTQKEDENFPIVLNGVPIAKAQAFTNDERWYFRICDQGRVEIS